MPEIQHNPKWKVGDEVSIEFIARVMEVKIEKDCFKGTEKVVYALEGNQSVRVYNVPEQMMYKLPEPEDFPGKCEFLGCSRQTIGGERLCDTHKQTEKELAR